VKEEREAAKTYDRARELIGRTLQQLSSACELRHIDASGIGDGRSTGILPVGTSGVSPGESSGTEETPGKMPTVPTGETPVLRMPPVLREVESNMSRAQFEKAVLVAKEHIVAGDIFQVVLSQRFQAGFKGDPLDLYRCLRLINPSPYMFCLRFGKDFS